MARTVEPDGTGGRALNAELQQFVRECLARGIARDDLRAQLAQAGWPADEVETALAAWADASFPVPVPRRRPHVSARETFLYLVMFVVLYVTAFSTGAVAFQFVNRWLPDPVTGRALEFESWRAALRNALAGIVIAFPLFAALARFIGRQRARDPERRESAVRKWLTYLTLFVAALVLIGDLITLVVRMLAGEMPPRFIAKFAIVLAIAAYVFGHYLTSLRSDEARRPSGSEPTWRARNAGVVVAIVAVTGIVLAGSPQQARHETADRQRIADLRRIAGAVDIYYGARDALPPSLDSLAHTNGSELESIQDPTTRRPYEYRAVNDSTYELCATFQTRDVDDDRTQPVDGSGRTPIFWRHPAGRACFRLQPITARPGVSAVPPTR